jgi:hypothetical protein
MNLLLDVTCSLSVLTDCVEIREAIEFAHNPSSSLVKHANKLMNRGWDEDY